MAKVKVSFGAILGHEHLSVLEGAHGAGINVNVGVKLEKRHLQTARFKDGGQRRGGDSLAQGRDNATGDKYVFGHVINALLTGRMREIWIIASISRLVGEFGQSANPVPHLTHGETACA